MQEEWLPLSVWEQRGWPEDVVKAHASKQDPKKGLLYNVDVEMAFADDIEEEVEARYRELVTNQQTKKEIAETLPGLHAFFPPADSQGHAKDGTSSSSSSSSSSAHGKKK